MLVITGLTQILAILGVVGVFVMNVMIAIGVYNDALEIRISPSKRLKVLSPTTWSFVCLFGSLLGLGLYLAAHYSVWAKEE